MPTKRLSMRRIHRLMTLHFGAGAATRAISRELGISHSTVREYLARIAAAGIPWPLPAEVTDQELERRLFVKSLYAVERCDRSAPAFHCVDAASARAGRPSGRHRTTRSARGDAAGRHAAGQ